MIELQNITKQFGGFTAVDNLSFSVSSGEVLGFLGPNGAGKSTTMKMITGFLAPTAGNISVCGMNIINDPIGAKKTIGYLPEGAPAYGDMTPMQFLNFVAQIRGLSGKYKAERMKLVVSRANIADVLHQPIDTLSKGYKRRVGLAQAIIHDPKVLILDEPTDGLDPNQKYEVRKLIQEMAQDKIIIVSTHILEEVSAVCSRAIIIARGKIVADGKPHELEEQSKYSGAVTIALDDISLKSTVIEELNKIDKVERVELDTITERITAFPINNEQIFNQVCSLVQLKEWQTKEIHQERGRFDDIFRTVTTSDAGEK